MSLNGAKSTGAGYSRLGAWVIRGSGSLLALQPECRPDLSRFLTREGLDLPAVQLSQRLERPPVPDRAGYHRRL